MDKAHYQIIFYVPIDHCEGVKNALFRAGAGKLVLQQYCIDGYSESESG